MTQYTQLVLPEVPQDFPPEARRWAEDLIEVLKGARVGEPPRGLSVTDGNLELVEPEANAIPTFSAVSAKASAPNIDQRVFLGHFGLDVTIGGSHTDSPIFGTHKVALYAGVTANQDAGDVWAFNTVTTLQPGLTSNPDSYGYELDFNNYFNDLGRDVFSPARFGLGVTGAGDQLSTAAILVAGSQNSLGVDPIWHRGLLFAGPSSDYADIESQSSATYFAKINGVHSYAIDTRDMLGEPMITQRGTFLYFANGIFPIPMIGSNSDNEVVLGTTTLIDARWCEVNYDDGFGGTGADFRVTDGGGASRWRQSGSDVFFQHNSSRFGTGTNQTFGSSTYNNAVNWNYGGNLKFSTAPDGITVTGTKMSLTGRTTVTGSRGGNVALANLLTALDAAEIITDSTTA